LKNKKWKKWDYNNENNLTKFFTAGHYHFGTQKYKNIIKKINKKLNFQVNLNRTIENNLLRFF
jgi:uncharacterized FAD-dependent dehydrogenase